MFNAAPRRRSSPSPSGRPNKECSTNAMASDAPPGRRSTSEDRMPVIVNPESSFVKMGNLKPSMP
eukprot:5963884-Pyramimonas_sp.AAC.1